MATYPLNGNYDPLVIGVFYTRDRLETALADLRSAGFSHDQLGVIARGDSGDWTEPAMDTEDGPAVAAGAATGAVAGAGLGGIWALGIAAGMLPAIGPVVAGGILGSILASAAVGAAAGGFAGALIGFGLSEEEAHFYESEVSAGRMVLTVRAGDRFALAASILEKNHAYEVRTAHASIGAEAGGTR